MAIEAGGEVYIVAPRLAADERREVRILKTPANWRASPATRWNDRNFQHPFLDRKILGVLADYVTMDTGTGVVHTAPSHGAEDFCTGVKYGLDATSNVDEKGIMRNGLPEYDGIKVWDANAPIIELLKKRGALLHTEKLEHSYPHCWRCHNPIIFRATEQWFISMEAAMPSGGTLRSRTLEDVEKVKWDPAWGKERMHNMIATRPDWCISTAAGLGRSNSGFPLPELRQAAERSRDQSQGCRTIRALGRRFLVHARSGYDSSRQHQMPGLQRNCLRARD